ncbi:MAG: amidase [Spirulinaceae cyanobacterium SM2_1_0]|nr:amidase [Spirulinaceae cyanobacterium SM2_1_0]
MSATDLVFASALTQAQLIRQGQVSPLALTELYLRRIERLDPQLGSFFTVAAEQAIADARTKTEQLAGCAPDELPPFFGVPTAIKDLNAVAGWPQSYGVAALKENLAQHDDGVVARMRAAGFVLLGKTATPELGLTPYTEPLGWPPTRNPWNLAHTSGGSSGGAAAAVAAGLLPIAQGSDGGGSIRTPAACCGLVGLKPSRGRVSHAPVGDVLGGIATDGPLGRTVADVAALLDVLSGYVTGDPYWLEPPEVPFLAALQPPPGPLRIAVSTELPPLGAAAEPQAAAVRAIAQRLEKLGHILEPATPNCTGLTAPFTRIWQASAQGTGLPPAALSPLARWLGEQAGSVGDYLRALAQMQIVARQIVGFFDTYDLLLWPSLLHAPPLIGAWAELAPTATLAQIIGWIAPGPPANASGLPAIALPAGFDAAGLPLSVQLVGKPAAEATLLAIAAQLEAEQPWHSKHPPF